VEIQVTGKYSPAAAIWTAGGNYVAVEWTVLLVSLASAGAFILATGKRFGDPRRNATARSLRFGSSLDALFAKTAALRKHLAQHTQCSQARTEAKIQS